MMQPTKFAQLFMKVDAKSSSSDDSQDKPQAPQVEDLDEEENDEDAYIRKKTTNFKKKKTLRGSRRTLHEDEELLEDSKH